MQLDLFNLIDAQGKASDSPKSATTATGAEILGEEFNQVLGLAIGYQMRPDGMGMRSAAEAGSGQPGQGPSGQELPTLRGWNLTSPVVIADDQPAAPVAGETQQSMPPSPQASLSGAARSTAEPLLVVGTEQPASAGGTGATLDLQASGTAMLEIAPQHGRPLPDRMPPPSLAPSAEAGTNAPDGRPVVGGSPLPGWQATAPYNPGGRPVAVVPPSATWQAEAPPGPDGRPMPAGVRPPTITPGEAVPPEARPVPEPATLPDPGSRPIQALASSTPPRRRRASQIRRSPRRSPTSRPRHPDLELFGTRTSWRRPRSRPAHP
jgi:hypothetical protein